MNIYEVRYDGYELVYGVSAKKALGIEPGKHIMNKNEAKVMRRLQAQTGLSQDEIREIKKYRKILSEAQDKGEIPKFVEE